MIIRIRSSAGTERIEIGENATLAQLKSKISDALKVSNFSLSTEPKDGKVLSSDSLTLKSFKLKHGDMLFLISSGKMEVQDEPSTPTVSTQEFEEDEIDKYLETQDGWIQRQRDPQL